MQTMIQNVESRRALLLMGALAALWVILAIARDGFTYHLAPLIVAAAPAIAAGSSETSGRAGLARLATVGAATALGVTFLLASMGRMDGSSLLPFGGAAAEAVIFAVAGSLVGWATAGGFSQDAG